MDAIIKKTTLRELCLLGALLAALAGSVWRWLDDAPPAPGTVLRVAAPQSEWSSASLNPFGKGFEQELLERFCASRGRELRWVAADSWDEAWEALAQGRADLVLGLGNEPPASLLTPIAAGPAYAHFRPLLVQDRRAGRRAGEAGVLLAESPALLAGLSRQADSLAFTPRAEVQEGHALPPVLDRLTGDRDRLALVDAGRFRLWQPFYPGLKAAGALPDSLLYRWYWSDADQDLSAGLAGFWKDLAGSAELKDLRDRYFGFLPEGADAYDLADLADAVRNRMSAHRETIAAASATHGVPPLLLTAVIYQESRFDPEAVSPTGVRGLMQLTQATARELGVTDRTDPAQSIEAGARYLRQMRDQIEAPGLHEWDRWFLALASYNAGLAHVQDAMDLALRKGAQAPTWREVKRVFPLLRLEKYARQASAGYARGAYQALDFVESVRYWCYVLHGIVVLARPEAENLAALVPDLPVPARS
ncbi:MAG: transglycosylase SLT domain-containing protein [Thermodesulfobacteriota bacterium]